VLFFHLLTTVVLYRRMLLMGTGDLLDIPDLVRTKAPEGLLGTLNDTLTLIYKRESFIFILSVLIIAQQPLAAFIIYGVGTVPMTVGVVLNDFRIARQTKASDAPVSV